MPTFRQLFIGGASGMELERKAYVIRKRAEHELGTNQGPGQDGPGRETVYFPSLSGKTLVYKGMLTTPQLKAFYLDLQDDRLESALGIVHSRFSTNTFPSWPLAHPFRRIAHNGEINTVTGNENWMRAREALIDTDVFGTSVEKVFPICTPRRLRQRALRRGAGTAAPRRSQPAARRADDDPGGLGAQRVDGPGPPRVLRIPRRADGALGRSGLGVLLRRHRRRAVLDRNGLRPSRIWVTDDGLVVMASEAGVLELDPAHVVQRLRLQPGRMFLVDTEQGRIISDEGDQGRTGRRTPRQWLDTEQFHLDDLPQGPIRMPHHRVVARQQAFGFTYEELNLLVAPMARTGAEALGSMGTDTPIAVLSSRPRMLFDYFQQLFAQVTNPPLDAIREEVA